MIKNIKEKIREWLLRGLVKIVRLEDTLVIRNNNVFIDKIKQSDREVAILKREAEYFAESKLWEYMTRERKYKAQQHLIERGSVGDEIALVRSAFLIAKTDKDFLSRLLLIETLDKHKK